MKTCGIEGCGRELYAKSICFMHYRRLRKSGEVGTATPVRRQPNGFCYSCNEKTSAVYCSKECRKSFLSRQYLATENGRERNLDSRDRRRAKIKGVKMPYGWRVDLFRKYPACLSCGSVQSLAVDHVVPLVMGGTHSVDNLQVLCKSCNSKKRDKTVDYRP